MGSDANPLQKVRPHTQRNEIPQGSFYCPSRRDATTYPSDRTSKRVNPTHRNANNFNTNVAKNDYAANAGVILQTGLTSGPANLNQGDSSYNWPSTRHFDGICFLRSKVEMRQVTDGLSKTYMVGEKYLNPDNYETATDGGDNGTAYDGANTDVLRSSHLALPPLQDRSRVSASSSWGSTHPGAFNMALCDGSVQTVSYDVDPVIHWRFGHKSDEGQPLDSNNL